jgi:hypothetical protein
MFTLLIMSFILIICDNIVAFGDKLASERQLIESIHDHSINFAVFAAPASFWTSKILLQAALAVET